MTSNKAHQMSCRCPRWVWAWRLWRHPCSCLASWFWCGNFFVQYQTPPICSHAGKNFCIELHGSRRKLFAWIRKEGKIFGRRVAAAPKGKLFTRGKLQSGQVWLLRMQYHCDNTWPQHFLLHLSCSIHWMLTAGIPRYRDVATASAWVGLAVR